MGIADAGRFPSFAVKLGLAERAAYGPRKGSNPPFESSPQSETLTSSPRDADAGHQGRKGSMSKSQLPERASLEYLKKLAKERLHVLRRADPPRSSRLPCSRSRAITDSRAGVR